MESVGTAVRRLGRYHLGEPVGGGPMGEVFRAQVHGVAGFEREFALKRFHAALIADDNSRAILRVAARHYAGLEHPRIARLHEHQLDGPTAYVAVEWIAGLDLARLVDATFGHGRPLPAGTATSILSRAARAVGYAHGRGHAHLGLSATNLLCTLAGEIKVTDFGFLPARLGPSPADDPTLVARIVYMSPEQLRGESTSPATDVFSLGSLFYELLTGTKAFTGRSSRDISAAILGAAPSTDAIPKPLARVLDRCFAQTPTDRYPSGGALADAIDAATRGLLMRGDQRDAAKAVQEARTRAEKLRKEQVSGALSFPMPAPPSAPLDRAGSSAAIASQRSLGVPNLELDEDVREEQTTDILQPTVQPAHQTSPQRRPQPSADMPLPHSMTIQAQAPPAPSQAPLPMFASTQAPRPRPELALSALPPPEPPVHDDMATVPFLRADEDLSTSPAYPGAAQQPPRQPPTDQPSEPPSVDGAPAVRAPSAFGAGLIEGRTPSSTGRKVQFGIIAAAVVAIGLFAFLLTRGDSDDKTAAIVAIDASSAARVAQLDEASTGALARDAGPAADARPPLDAGSAELKVTSDPRRATVYLDGTKIGKTPVSVETARDQHKLVVVRPGYQIHIADIDGGGALNIKLEEVTPSGGPAGIKVRCRKKNRYYVWVDQRETGQLCPTERIEVDLGSHVVEIYDPVTDSRRRFDVDVTQTRRSHRIRVD